MFEHSRQSEGLFFIRFRQMVKDISIGKNLHRLRKQAGLSQEQVAVKLQVMGLPVSREIISQMELGRYSIRVSVLIALKQIYGVSYEEFFQGLPDSR